MKLKAITFTATLLTSMLISAQGTEYFVSLQGSDAHNGLSSTTAFLTIQKGVDALQPGDILTIAPGEYFEAAKRENLGRPGTETMIRAQIPGTVLLRGDVPVPAFKPVEGYRYVYATDFAQKVQSVNGVDTLTIMSPVSSVVEVEYNPGTFFYDASNKKLYVSTPDMQPPDWQHYTVSVISNYGLFLYLPVGVSVEGLTATGYNYTGIALVSARDCVVRECTAFLNGSGIVVDSALFNRYSTNAVGQPVYSSFDETVTNRAGGNTIAHCRGYGNYSSWGGGNIIVYHSNDDLIRNCVSFGSTGYGIRHYGALRGPAVLRENLEWGDTLGMDTKGGGDVDGVAHGLGLAERCVALGDLFHVAHVSHNLTAQENRYNSNPGLDNVRYDLEAAATRDLEFADPDNHDFRLQADSQFRGTAPDGSDRGPFQYQTNIFYVKPSGDDLADGLSAAKAWKTLARGLKDLKSGDTLYLEGGEYQAGLDLKKVGGAGENISVRGRGIGTVVMKGVLRIAESEGIAFERLNFTDGITITEGKNIAFNNCRLTGTETSLHAQGVDGLKLTHCLFTGFKRSALELKSCKNVFLSGNIFDNARGAAVGLDEMAAVLYSDYNSYRKGDGAWEVGGNTLPLAELQKQHEVYSRVIVPEITREGALAMLKNQNQFSTGGPQGTALGVFRKFKEKTVHVSKPEVHSVTPTTANLEWMTSLPTRCDIAWGESPDCTNRLVLNAHGFASLSLTGLRPGTTYHFKIAEVRQLATTGDFFNPKEMPHSVMSGSSDERAREDRVGSVVFKTPDTMVAPVVFYVAPDGNNGHDGLSRETAFRSITHAADQVNAGDTVMIAGGTYHEVVQIRATGLPDRPITFKSMPGEHVTLEGSNVMARAFIVGGKRHIHFDGLYFRKYTPDNRVSGVFLLYQSDDVQIRRCFYDGRFGYVSSFVMAWGCADLTVRNCAIISSFYGNLYLVKCPNAVIENNAIIRSLIQQCIFVNEPGQKVSLKRNIITDNVPHKVLVALVEVACATSLNEADNAYYFRIPAVERKMFMFYDPLAYSRTVEGYGLTPVDASQLAPTLEQITLAEYQQRSGNISSFAVNPGFAATVAMPETDAEGKPVFLVDSLLNKKDLDFPDLFATNPEVVKRGIGLQPEAFKEFHFNTKEGGH